MGTVGYRDPLRAELPLPAVVAAAQHGLAIAMLDTVGCIWLDLGSVAAWPVHACHSAIGSGLEGHTGPLTGRWRIAGSVTWHWGYDGHTAGAG